MLRGSLIGWFFDDDESWRIPGWAWAEHDGDWRALVDGNDFLPPLAPPEVRRWAWRAVYLEQGAFEAWLASGELSDQDGLWALPPAFDAASRPSNVTYQPPPDRPNISLGHAVSFLAFGISLDAHTLTSAMASGAFALNPVDATRRLAAAVETLATAATRDLRLFGKFVPSGADDDSIDTGPIQPDRLEDYRQFDVICDGLRRGVGVVTVGVQPQAITFNRAFPARQPMYIDVKAEREGVMRMRQSAEQADAGVARADPAPSDLDPGSKEETQSGPWYPARAGDEDAELPLWLNMHELLAWVRYRDPVIVARSGNWAGAAGYVQYGTKAQIGCESALLKTLQSGALVAQGAKQGESFAVIPPVEWTRLRIAPWDPAPHCPYVFIRVSRADVESLFPGSLPVRGLPHSSRDKLPSDEAIYEKMHELIGGGMRRDEAAKHIRSLLGFAEVQNEHARRVVRGTLPLGRPKKAAQKAAGKSA